MSQDRIQSYQEFWPYYLEEHAEPANRALHFLGTTLSAFFLLVAVLGGGGKMIFAALLFGYGFAWTGHIFIEKNRPATFRYPLWSLYSDFRMWALMWRGKLDRELSRQNLT